MNYIEKNLYAFYSIFGSSYSVRHIVEKDYEVIMSESGYWPQMIYNIQPSVPPDEIVPKITSGISEKGYPPFFIAPDNYISRAHAGILKKYGIMPVKMLYGMNLDVHSLNEYLPNKKFTVSELVAANELNQFNDLINSELLSDDLRINPTLLKDLKNNQVKLFGIKENEMLISALFVLELENKAGLYFIVTRKEFQQKGYATMLIRFVINHLNNNQINELILHANQNASGLYRKIGFINQNRFIIYRKF